MTSEEAVFLSDKVYVWGQGANSLKANWFPTRVHDLKHTVFSSLVKKVSGSSKIGYFSQIQNKGCRCYSSLMENQGRTLVTTEANLDWGSSNRLRRVWIARPWGEPCRSITARLRAPCHGPGAGHISSIVCIYFPIPDTNTFWSTIPTGIAAYFSQEEEIEEWYKSEAQKVDNCTFSVYCKGGRDQDEIGSKSRGRKRPDKQARLERGYRAQARRDVSSKIVDHWNTE